MSGSSGVSITIIGVSGRMGREVALAALNDPETRVVAGLEQAGSQAIGQDIGTLCGAGAIGVLVSDDAQAAGFSDVLVEFSSPDASVEHAELAARLGKAGVIGTTGFSAEQLARIRAAAEHAPLLLAPNMSVGVNLLMKVLPAVAQALGDGYDIEITETHHKHKKDAPSGTALALGQVIASALGREWSDAAVFGRHGLASRQAGDIGVHAQRAGGNIGEHQILFANEGEEITITHRALSRQTFALGAIRAAKFVAGRSPGLYSFRDLLEA